MCIDHVFEEILVHQQRLLWILSWTFILISLLAIAFTPNWFVPKDSKSKTQTWLVLINSTVNMITHWDKNLIIFLSKKCVRHECCPGAKAVTRIQKWICKIHILIQIYTHIYILTHVYTHIHIHPDIYTQINTHPCIHTHPDI